MTDNNNKNTKSTTNQYVDVSRGMTLRSKTTDHVYEVVNVDGDDVFLDRLGCPVSKSELEEDIGDGIEVLLNGS